jgi:hypothetical protein
VILKLEANPGGGDKDIFVGIAVSIIDLEVIHGIGRKQITDV